MDIAFIIKCNLADYTVESHFRHGRSDGFAIDRIRQFDGVGDSISRIVSKRCVQLRFLAFKGFLEVGGKLGAFFHFGQRQAQLGTNRAFTGFTGQFDEFIGTNAVGTDKLGINAQFTHLFHQGSGGVVHAAPEYVIRILRFNAGENGFKVGGFVGGRFAVGDVGTACFQVFGDFIRQTFTVLSGIIDHCNIFAAFRQNKFGQYR